MLTLDKPAIVAMQPAKSIAPCGHVTAMQVYNNLVRQTNIQTAIAAGFIAAAVDLSHDCSMDADHSLVDGSTRKMVDAFVSEFYHANYDALMAHYNTGLYFHWGWIGVGSDLFLTVAGHGCGFWEHETGKPLSAWLENYGCEFYACHNGNGTLEGYECYMWKYGKA